MGRHFDADLIILGGGAAGLSLASRLARSGARHTVRVLEPRPHYTDDRSWCFWRPAQHDLSRLVSRRWPSWTFARDGGSPVRHALPGQTYQYIRARDFYSDALSAIADAPQIGLELGVSARDVHPDGAGLVVETAQGALRARNVIDTRPPTARITRHSTLFQCFVGRELTVPDAHPGFDPGTAELMTDMRVDRLGFIFTYLLPLSARTALVEITRFSFEAVGRGQLGADLDALLVRRGFNEASVAREEFGVLPMGLPAETPPRIPGVYRAGIGAGGLRAASGYGFLRIQRWAELCTQRILSGAGPVSHPRQGWITRRANQIFLRALKANPHRSPDFFMAMAKALPPETLIRFMGEDASLADYLRVASCLPTRPLVQAALGLNAPLAATATVP